MWLLFCLFQSADVMLHTLDAWRPLGSVLLLQRTYGMTDRGRYSLAASLSKGNRRVEFASNMPAFLGAFSFCLTCLEVLMGPGIL